MLKMIFFVASPDNGEESRDNFLNVVRTLVNLEQVVLAPWFDRKLLDEKKYKDLIESIEWTKLMRQDLGKSDRLIIDASMDLHDIGYILGMAEMVGIPTLVLCPAPWEYEMFKPHLLNGNEGSRLVYYGQDSIPRMVTEFVKEAVGSQGTTEGVIVIQGEREV